MWNYAKNDTIDQFVSIYIFIKMNFETSVAKFATYFAFLNSQLA